MKSGKFQPINGKCYTGAGQSMVAMVEMLHHIDHGRKPVIFALYDAIFSANYEVNADILEAHNVFPGGYLQIGLALPLHDDQGLEALGKGQYDEALTTLVRTYKSIGLPIFLRIGYEFDGPWNGYAPRLFIKAYRHIVDVFRKEQADNIAFVWNTYICDNQDIFHWFPHDPDSQQQDGGNYIDWFAYNTVTAKFEADWFMEQARAYDKPVMIGEASYAIVEEDMTFETWVDCFFTKIKQHHVQGYQYINWDWHVYPEATNWLDWACGRYTLDKQKVAQYNAYLDDYFVYRGQAYAQPVKLFVHCARGLKESDEKGMSWCKDKDHYTMESGYNYHLSESTLQYGDGWKPYWQSLEDHMALCITLPKKTEGYLLLDVLDYSPNQMMIITVNDETYNISHKGNGYIKIPLSNTDDKWASIEVAITAMNSQVKLHQVGFMEIAYALHAVGHLQGITQDDKTRIQWTQVKDAFTYNVYINHWLQAITQELHYDLEKIPEGSVIAVSPVSRTKGEGLLSKIVL
ncbi:hypothetical protein HZI73_01055 [Vallitalea pronyensis]|uniref:GH26 domain-containing protein n=1 Tax=Vallitalea pronyensis TaxID=1348613 RepID=A0A8J8SF76_9FIRM|nr:hypothetical protein [Vallitalea pronyensis]QUI20968.1 hypothetical protein HZI73_01055 [Vallitalea pronyensis]